MEEDRDGKGGDMDATTRHGLTLSGGSLEYPLFACEVIMLGRGVFKNCIWYLKKWEDVAWQPRAGMQRTSVVFPPSAFYFSLLESVPSSTNAARWGCQSRWCSAIP